MFTGYLEYVFLLYGVQLASPRHRIVKLINVICRCHVITINLIALCLFFPSFKLALSFMYLLECPIDYMSCLHFVYNQIKRRTDMMQLISNITQLLRKRDVQELLNRSKVYFAIVIGNYVAQVVYTLANADKEQIHWEKLFWGPIHKQVVTMSLRNVLYWYSSVVVYLGTTSFIIMALFYMFLLHALQLAIKNYFHSLTNHHVTQKTATRIWREICIMKFDFEQLFSSYPLLSFVVLFFRTTVYIAFMLNYSSNFDDKRMKVLVLYFFLVTLIAPFAIIFKVDAINTMARSMFNQYKLVTVSSHNNDLCDEIENSLTLKLTALGLFDLDKTLVLGFVSAVVSFTILSIQWSK